MSPKICPQTQKIFQGKLVATEDLIKKFHHRHVLQSASVMLTYCCWLVGNCILYLRLGIWIASYLRYTVGTRVADPELEPEPAFFGSSGAGAVKLPGLRSLLWLQTSLKITLNGRNYVKVSKKYAESADM